MWHRIFFWRPKPATLSDLSDRSPDEAEFARFFEARQKLMMLCDEAIQACTYIYLRHKLEDVRHEVDQWSAGFPEQARKTRDQGIAEMAKLDAFLRRITPQLPKYIDGETARRWADTLEKLENWFWRARENQSAQESSLSLEDLRPLLEAVPKPPVAPQIEKFEHWLGSQDVAQREQVLAATRAVVVAAEAWDRDAEKIQFRTQRGRGDFLLEQVVSACDAMRASEHLMASDTAWEKLTATMQEVSSFLTDALLGLRASDEADFLNQLTAVQKQAR